MEEALELARAKDTKERMAAVERLYQLLEGSRKSLTSSEVTSLVDCCLNLLKDNNFRVSQGALEALASAAVLSGNHLKLHFNPLVPAVVERLGDAKQPVRDAARRLLLTLMEVSSPTIIVERAGSYAWTHRSWRVREEFARTVTSSISLFASTELPLQRAILPPILQLLNDSNPGVREVAILCIEEMYTQAGTQFRDELHRHQLPGSMMRDINARLEKIEPQVRSSDLGGFAAGDIKPAIRNPKKSSPKGKSSSRETSLFGGESDITEKPIDPIKIYSDKELIRDFEKIASTLVPKKDWSVRIAAMQRVEGLVSGGAADYPCFRGFLKQLVGPLSTQLLDRRSSIVKQICNGNDESSTVNKHDALHQINEISVANDLSVWSKYANQILTAVLEVLDDSDSSIRELALSLIIEMLKNQKGVMEDSVEIVIEKLLHVMKDTVPKVSNEAEHCLNIVLSQYDPFRCLSVIVPLLVTEDEKTLVICINCLTKLVGRLSQEELTAQLPSFLPALFEAFGNQSADVRKTVAFCLVDIYIMLGKAFLPHLEGLNSTQLRLVTIYANRISQARTGTPIDASHD